MDLVFFVAGFLGLGLLQPVDELLHLLHEDGPPLGNVVVLVPLEDDLLAEDLSLVEEEHDLVEALEETLVVVAVFLDLVAENHLALCRAREGREQRDVLLQMSQCLLLDQVLLLVGLHGRHSVLLDCVFQIHDYFLDRLLVIDGGLQCSLDVFLGARILHPGQVGDDLLLVGGDEDVLHVLRGSLVGREELVQVVVQTGLLQQTQNRGGTFFSLDDAENLQHEVQSDSFLDLMFIDDDLERVGRQQTRDNPESSHLSQTLTVLLGESLEVH